MRNFIHHTAETVTQVLYATITIAACIAIGTAVVLFTMFLLS